MRLRYVSGWLPSCLCVWRAMTKKVDVTPRASSPPSICGKVQ